jgi:hypothetical protein
VTIKKIYRKYQINYETVVCPDCSMIHMRAQIFSYALCLMILATPVQSRATDLAVTERVGAVNLSLPLPAGFTEPSALVPQLRQLGETMTPPTTRLLAIFVSDKDVKLALSGTEVTLIRYFVVQTSRKNEENTFTINDFSKFRNVLRGQFQELIASAAPEIQGQLDSASRSIGKGAGINDFQLRVGETKAIEIFDDTSTSISLLFLSKHTVQVAGKVEEVPMAMALTTAIVKGKLVNFNAYSRYRSSQDIEWIRSQTKMWLTRVNSAN